MSAILKYPLKLQRVQKVEMPKGARIIYVAAQFEIPCLWAIVDISEPPEERMIGMVVTGAHFASDELKVEQYLGSFQLQGGKFVEHVFEGKS